MSSNSIFPLLIGLGSGAALTYFLSSNRKPAYRNYDRVLNNRTFESDFLNAGNEENFAKYTDAEREIEKRQHHLEDRVQSLRTESNLPINDREDSFNLENETNINKAKGKSANQGKF